MYIIKHKKFFLLLSSLLVVASIAVIGLKGLSYGIEFTGGSIVEVVYDDRAPSRDEIAAVVSDALATDTASVRRSGEQGYVIRTTFLSTDEHEKLIGELSFDATRTFTEERFSSVGPTIGEELKQKALVAMSIVIVVIILFVAFAFRGVSKPVSSWFYGLSAIMALAHDMLVPTAVFAIIGADVDVLFVTALLAILGFSVNDTIVVFDRVRENLKTNKEDNVLEPFTDTVGKSLSQSFTRSINTSLTTLIALLALFFLGGSTTQMFALTLAVGVITGTYSSLFFASPLLVLFNRKK